MTYRTFIDDILVALGMGHDDALWSQDNILLNTIYAENLLVTQSIAKDTGLSGDGISSTHKRRVVCVPITQVECSTECDWEHAYFDLPSEVYDLPSDGGITMMRYAKGCGCGDSLMGASFTPTTLERLSALSKTPYQKPSKTSPYYARYTSEEGTDRVGIFGISDMITKLLVGLYYAPKFDTMSLDEEMRIDPHRLHDLKRLVLKMSVWPLSIPQERDKNDGRDFEPGQVVNTPPIIGINDPILNSNITEQ